jgi:hypothetical protein
MTRSAGESARSVSLDEIVYRGRFERWEQRAAVRTKPRRVLACGEDRVGLYFPPEIVPVATHELVARRGEEATNRVLMQRLHVYLDFTAELEQQVVNPICAAVSRGHSGLRLPDAMLEDAFKIYTDEAWHAQFSDDLQRQIVRATGVPAVRPQKHAFMRSLVAMQAALPSNLHPLSSVFAAIVSETLISAILSNIPRDGRMVAAVREVVSDHAIDEGVHHAYFASLLEHAWPQLAPRERTAIGVQLAGYIRAYLDPDTTALAEVLFDAGLPSDDVGQVLHDAHAGDRVDRDTRADARVTLRHLARVGVLDDPAVLEAFQAARLLDARGVSGIATDEATAPRGPSLTEVRP